MLKIPKSSTGVLFIEFLPLKLGNFDCSIVLSDDEVGEMEYKIEAKVTLPVHEMIPKLKGL